MESIAITLSSKHSSCLHLFNNRIHAQDFGDIMNVQRITHHDLIQILRHYFYFQNVNRL